VANKQPTEEKKSSKPKKRQLRPAQTMREQSQKAIAKAEKPSRKSKVRKAVAAPFRVLGKPFKALGRIKFFRIIGRILWPTYFRNSFRELRQVTWPNRKQSRQLTVAVIIFSVIFGVMIAIVDFGLDKVFKKVILKQ
jgi:preprotein translocase subunit SecE